MCILYQSYYVKHNKIRSSEEEYLPCKFTVENNEIIRYETPKEGKNYNNLTKEIFPKDKEYKRLVREMFPYDIQNKVLHYHYNENIGNNFHKLENHYSYLGRLNIIITHDDYTERAIAVYGSYGGNSNKAEANTIRGKYIDGYGDIFEYTIPCNENQELMVKIDYIDKETIKKYKGNKVGSISKEELDVINEQIKNMEYDYKNIDDSNNNNKLSFLKVLNSMEFGYTHDDFITLIENTDKIKEKNITEQSQIIINILEKYDMA